ncbi:MAG: hypothetical protein R3B70_06520 [Polyangiaceae bacterium]
MAPGYRESIRDTVEEVEREELLAAMAETSAKLDALQKKLDEMGDPKWIIALRVAGLVAVWGSLAAAGGWLLGVWGVVGVVAAPFVLFVLWAFLEHPVGNLIRGERRAIGELSLWYDTGAHMVIFAWSGAPSAIPLGLLAHLDRASAGGKRGGGLRIA